MVRLTFLGTGTSQGVPMIACPCEVCHSGDPRDKRLRSSVLVETGGRNIVIDAGPDFRAQMLRADVHTLDGILLTHEHKDHTGGIDDVRAYNYFQQAPVDIYATERVGRAVRRDYAYAFDDHPYPGVPDIALHTIGTEPFDVKGVEVVPVTGLHLTLPVTGFRIGNVAYLTDFNRIEHDQIMKIRGVDVLVINALRYEKHISHFSVQEAILLSRYVGTQRTYLTHLSHQIGLHSREERRLTEGVFLAYDGLTIETE
ncbi:MAG: MBL fold metallo-hydrolase [Rikenellaceae bacterium]|nr:MBL fold metallo-hydrolase [Rikenellaceae bacterium]